MVRATKILAFLMMYLMISLTFFSAFAIGTIYKAEIYGQDKVPGSIRPTDTITVRTESTMPCSIYSQSFNISEYTQMSCSGNAPVVCTYSKQLKDQYEYVSAAVIELTSSMPLARELQAYPDFLAPKIISLSSMSLGNQAKIFYVLRDYGSESYPEKCSGIKKVELFINNQLASTKEYEPGNCQVNDFILGTKPNFLGSVNTSIKVYDYMGYTVNMTGESVFIDAVPPNIQATAKAYKPGTDQEINAAVVNSSITMNIEVRVIVNDSAIPRTGGAIADFSMFDRTNTADQKRVEGICERNGWEETYICSFPDVKLNLQTLSLKFPVNITDVLGNTAGKIVSISFTAHQGASISSSAKVFFQGSENEIKKISTNASREILGDAQITITDPAQPLSVAGNFQELSRTSGQRQTTVPGECNSQEEGTSNNTYVCWFKNIIINPDKATPKAIISVLDELGKEVRRNVSFSFTPINNAGTVTRLGPPPERCQANTCYLKKGTNTVYALINSQSSFYDNQLRINGLRAECKYNATWNCTAQVTANMGDTSLKLEGTDDFGNPITYTQAIIVDNTPPSLIGEITATPSCPVAGESLKIIMNITEDKNATVRIYADTSKISNNALTQASCSRASQPRQWNCVLTITNIIEEEVPQTILEVIVEDAASNQLKKEVPVSVCISIEEIPDLIKEVRTRGILPRIDRKTAKAITIKTPIGLQIIPASQEVEIIASSQIRCPNTPCSSGTPYTINEGTLTPTLILPIRWTRSCQDALDEAETPDTIPVTCTQEYKIKLGNKIYRQMEQENFTFQLELYNQAGLNSTYNIKINEIKKEIQRLDKQIAKRQKIHKTLGGICTLAENLGKVNSLLQSVKATLWAVSAALPFIGETIWQPVFNIIGPYQAFVDSKVWPQGWVPTSGNHLGLLIKYSCSIYTCKFYDFNTLADIGISVAAYYATKDDNFAVGKECDKSGNCVTKYKDGTTVTTRADGTKEVYNAAKREYTTYDKNGNVVETYILVDLPKPRMDLSSIILNSPQIEEPTSSDFKYQTETTPTTEKTKSAEKPSSSQTSGQSEKKTVDDKTKNTATTSKPKVPTADEAIKSFLKSLPGDLQTTNYKQKVLTSDGNVYFELYFSDKTRSYVYSPKTGKLSKVQDITTIKLSNPLQSKVVAFDQLSGYGVVDSTKNLVLGKNFVTKYGAGPDFSFDTNVRIGNALDAFLGDSGSWIYNPYKSKHYDGLCYPATLFNDRKEKQILCKRLGCLEQMAEKGGPIGACEFEYDLDNCLYVESARYKLEGSATFGKIIENFFKVMFNNIVGLGTTITYLFVFPGCVHYQTGFGYLQDSGPAQSPKALRSVLCGTIGSLLSLREMIAFAKNPYNPMSKVKGPPALPANSYDYCARFKSELNLKE